MIDNLSIIMSLGVIVYACVRAVVFDRTLPWFGKKKVVKPTNWR